MTIQRILVLGASGMLGHRAAQLLASDFEVWGACRNPKLIPNIGIPAKQLLGGLDAMDASSASRILDAAEPNVVVNAVGIVKQREEAKAAVPSIAVNSLWPHALADACAPRGIRMVHVSTDCVFSGRTGGYTERDAPDAMDLYGRSKLLGEVVDRAHVVTLRTSIIGWQLGEATGLLGWFAAHRNEALRGYSRAVFSGLTTTALTEVIRDVVLPDETLSGLWHVSADPIDKYTLLRALAEHLGWSIRLERVEEPVVDRSLDSTKFRTRTGWHPPTWSAMLRGLAQEFSA